MANQTTKKCAHPSCNCMAEKDSKYCSAYCKDAGSTTEIGCNCGHAGCEVGAGSGTSMAQG
jgi:hypothetical protein